MQGQRVYVERDRFTLRVNNAKVQGAAVRASNGVIYVIDSVLLPQFR
ncbi:MAG: fasciclin domain-containing protein [Pseudomonadota bacterium]